MVLSDGRVWDLLGGAMKHISKLKLNVKEFLIDIIITAMIFIT